MFCPWNDRRIIFGVDQARISPGIFGGLEIMAPHIFGDIERADTCPVNCSPTLDSASGDCCLARRWRHRSGIA